MKDMPESYYSIYGTSSESLLDYELQTIAQKLLSVLQNLGEYPHIRYSTKPQAFSTSPQKSLSYRLASLLDSELTRLCRSDPTFPPSSSYDRGILIITDRTLDILSVLLHDVHYQSMLTDLLPFHNQRYKDLEGKEIILDETDLIYKSVRTWHIGDVTEYVQHRLEQFTSTNEAAKYEISGARTTGEIEQLKGVMESFQDYAKTKEALARHVNICLRVSKVYESRGLERIVEFEQELVTSLKGDKSLKRVLKDIDLVLVDSSIE
jgi:Sec1 family